MRLFVSLVACAATVAVAAATASASASASAPSITPTSIAGLKLGLKATAYEKALRSPWHLQVAKGGDAGQPGFQQPENWTRLVFPKLKVNVYFDGPVDGGEKAVLITTWSKAMATAEGIAPCSNVTDLKKAYGSKLKPSKFNTVNGTVYVYTMGNLLFADEYGIGVTAVGLYDSKAPGANKQGGALSYAGFVIQPPNQTSCV